MFVYKPAETIEYVIIKWSTCLKKYKLYESITRGFVGLRIRNFHGIIFISNKTYREIFKSALAYLQEHLSWRTSAYGCFWMY